MAVVAYGKQDAKLAAATLRWEANYRDFR